MLQTASLLCCPPDTLLAMFPIQFYLCQFFIHLYSAKRVVVLYCSQGLKTVLQASLKVMKKNLIRTHFKETNYRDG